MALSRAIITGKTMELTLHLVEEKRLTRWLGNLKNMGRMQVQDAQWREEVWFPRFVNSTIQKVAIVLSEDYYNYLTFNETIKLFDKNTQVERRLFPNLPEANAWIRANA
jgi:hypothetical protein